MNSLKRLWFPLLGALIVFLVMPCISSAATVSLGALVTAGTAGTPLVFTIAEGAFDHNTPNPLVLTITGAAFGSGQGDVFMNEPGGSPLSDVVRFVNVGGVATITFASSDFMGVIPTLSGSSPGTIATVTEGVPGYKLTLPEAGGGTITAILTSDLSTGSTVGGLSDHIELSATAPTVPEPSTFTLAGLGALGLLIRSYRRRRA